MLSKFVQWTIPSPRKRGEKRVVVVVVDSKCMMIADRTKDKEQVNADGSASCSSAWAAGAEVCPDECAYLMRRPLRLCQTRVRRREFDAAELLEEER